MILSTPHARPTINTDIITIYPPIVATGNIFLLAYSASFICVKLGPKKSQPLSGGLSFLVSNYLSSPRLVYLSIAIFLIYLFGVLTDGINIR